MTVLTELLEYFRPSTGKFPQNFHPGEREPCHYLERIGFTNEQLPLRNEWSVPVERAKAADNGM